MALWTPTYVLTDRFDVPASPEETWRFFSAAGNLATITPPWMRFTVTCDPSIQMLEGTLLTYTIRWMKLPIRWRTLISAWNPPHSFEDMQISGPYAMWHHRHWFEPLPDGGTRCADRVIYRLPMGILGPVAHGAIVRRQLQEIFRFRRRAIGQCLGGCTPVQPDVAIQRL